MFQLVSNVFVQIMSSDDYLNVLHAKVFPSIFFFLPYGLSIFQNEIDKFHLPQIMRCYFHIGLATEDLTHVQYFVAKKKL